MGSGAGPTGLAGPGPHPRTGRRASDAGRVRRLRVPLLRRGPTIVNAIRARMGDRVRFVFRHFPLTTVHPYATAGGRGGRGGGRPGQVLGDARHAVRETSSGSPRRISWRTPRRSAWTSTAFSAELAEHVHAPRSGGLHQRRAQRRERHADLLHQRRAPRRLLGRREPAGRPAEGSRESVGRRSDALTPSTVDARGAASPSQPRSLHIVGVTAVRAVLPRRRGPRRRQGGPQALQRLRQSQDLRSPAPRRGRGQGQRPRHHRAVRPADHQGAAGEHSRVPEAGRGDRAAAHPGLSDGAPAARPRLQRRDRGPAARGRGRPQRRARPHLQDHRSRS